MLRFHALQYDLDFAGDEFMNVIEPISARVPYHVCPGNHETKSDFGQYKVRFTMPGEGRTSNNLWYSFDYGNIHFCAINSEVSSDFLSLRRLYRNIWHKFIQAWFKYKKTGKYLEDQMKWLTKDLKEVGSEQASNIPTVDCLLS